MWLVITCNSVPTYKNVQTKNDFKNTEKQPYQKVFHKMIMEFIFKLTRAR